MYNSVHCTNEREGTVGVERYLRKGRGSGENEPRKTITDLGFVREVVHR